MSATATVQQARNAEVALASQLHAVADALAEVGTGLLSSAVARVRAEAEAAKARLAAGLSDVALILGDLMGSFDSAREMLEADCAAPVTMPVTMPVAMPVVAALPAPAPAPDPAPVGTSGGGSQETAEPVAEAETSLSPRPEVIAAFTTLVPAPEVPTATILGPATGSNGRGPKRRK